MNILFIIGAYLLISLISAAITAYITEEPTLAVQMFLWPIALPLWIALFWISIFIRLKERLTNYEN